MYYTFQYAACLFNLLGTTTNFLRIQRASCVSLKLVGIVISCRCKSHLSVSQRCIYTVAIPEVTFNSKTGHGTCCITFPQTHLLV